MLVPVYYSSCTSTSSSSNHTHCLFVFQFGGDIFPRSASAASREIRCRGRPRSRLKQLCQVLQDVSVSLETLSNSLCDYRRTPNGYESVDVDFVFPLQYCTFILQESHLLECMHPASLPYSREDTRSEVHQQGSQCGQKTDSFPSLFFSQDAGLPG